MTIHQAIARFDLLYPNKVSVASKIKALSDLDKKVAVEIMHKDVNIFQPLYDDTTDANTELLVPFPYDDIYIKYLNHVFSITAWIVEFCQYKRLYERSKSYDERRTDQTNDR